LISQVYSIVDEFQLFALPKRRSRFNHDRVDVVVDVVGGRDGDAGQRDDQDPVHGREKIEFPNFEEIKKFFFSIFYFIFHFNPNREPQSQPG